MPHGGGYTSPTGPAALPPHGPGPPASVHTLRPGPKRHAFPLVAPLARGEAETQRERERETVMMQHFSLHSFFTIKALRLVDGSLGTRVHGYSEMKSIAKLTDRFPSHSLCLFLKIYTTSNLWLHYYSPCNFISALVLLFPPSYLSFSILLLPSWFPPCWGLLLHSLQYVTHFSVCHFLSMFGTFIHDTADQ